MNEADMEFQNLMVLHMVQAMAGAISSEIHAVSIDTDRASRDLDVYVHASMPLSDPDFQEDLEGEIDALTRGSVAVKLHVWVGNDPASWPGRGKRVIFARRWD